MCVPPEGTLAANVDSIAIIGGFTACCCCAAALRTACTSCSVLCGPSARPHMRHPHHAEVAELTLAALDGHVTGPGASFEEFLASTGITLTAPASLTGLPNVECVVSCADRGTTNVMRDVASHGYGL